jgi:hypothetical protein
LGFLGAGEKDGRMLLPFRSLGLDKVGGGKEERERVEMGKLVVKRE